MIVEAIERHRPGDAILAEDDDTDETDFNFGR